MGEQACHAVSDVQPGLSSIYKEMLSTGRIAVIKAYDSAMNSFIGSLHGTSRSGSSSSDGGCDAIY